ncbi:MAG: hypothetical protein AAFO72_01335 [Pseudomonadota bacterium]
MKASLFVAALLMALYVPSMSVSDETEDERFDLLKSAEILAHKSLMRRINHAPDGLAAFETDGCSGGMSAGWSLVSAEMPELAGTPDGDLPWTQCCVDHDKIYHVAGGATDADASYEARLAADDALRLCVIAIGEERKDATMERFGLSEAQVVLAYTIVARSMYNAVRVGGGPCSFLPWRWGFGYPNC